VAGVTVTGDGGEVLVDAGQRIDDTILDRARRVGKIGAVAASAVSAQTQDLKESLHSHYAHSESGREKRLLESVDEYREARNYLGRSLTMDVTDVRGNIVVPSGKALDDEDVRAARDAGLISALLAAAEQAPAPGPIIPSAPAPSFPAALPRPLPILLGGPDGEPDPLSRVHISSRR